MQPAWRLPLDVTQPLFRDATLSSDGWAEVCKGGRNGFLLVILCLAWWAEAVGDTDAQFQAMLDDVHWALQRLIEKVLTPQVRSRSPAAAPRSSKRKAGGPSTSATASARKR